MCHNLNFKIFPEYSTPADIIYWVELHIVQGGYISGYLSKIHIAKFTVKNNLIKFGKNLLHNSWNKVCSKFGFISSFGQ